MINELTVLVDPAGGRQGYCGVPVSRVLVRWENELPRVAPEARAYLERRWECYVADAQAHGRTLFNGPISRLIRAAYRESSREAGGTVELTLGPADYKTFLVAHLRDRAWFAAHAPEVSAGALGNSVLLTHGSRALLGIRSKKVSAYAGRAHLIGGVLDLLDPEAQKRPSAEHLVSHLLKELGEEAGVRLKDLVPREWDETWPRLLGVALDEYLSQPEAIWRWETGVRLEEIAERLNASEHEGSIVVGRDRPSSQVWEQLTPVARHAWLIWSGNWSNPST